MNDFDKVKVAALYLNLVTWMDRSANGGSVRETARGVSNEGQYSYPAPL